MVVAAVDVGGADVVVAAVDDVGAPSARTLVVELLPHAPSARVAMAVEMSIEARTFVIAGTYPLTSHRRTDGEDIGCDSV